VAQPAVEPPDTWTLTHWARGCRGGAGLLEVRVYRQGVLTPVSQHTRRLDVRRREELWQVELQVEGGLREGDVLVVVHGGLWIFSMCGRPDGQYVQCSAGYWREGA